jgi:alanyl-tRNA synthetase
VASVTKDLVERGLNAGRLIKEVARVVGGSGGGRDTMAQAGGRDASKMGEALASVPGLVERGVRGAGQ